jgi:hypothetical protein
MQTIELFDTSRKRGLLFLAGYILSLITCGSTVRADEGIYPITASDRDFFREIRNAVLAQDIDRFANAVAYPIVLRSGRHEIIVRNKKALKKNAKLVFNEHLKPVVKSQSPDTLFKNWQGVMIGDGQIWFSKVIEDGQKQGSSVFRIVAINLGTARP